MKSLPIKFNLRLTALLLLFSLFATTAISQEPPPPAMAAPTQPNGDTILYRVSGNGLEKPSYLFGTIHLICESQMFGLDKLEDLIKSTGQVVLEIDLNNARAEMNKAMDKLAKDGQEFGSKENFKKEIDRAFKLVGEKSSLSPEEFKLADEKLQNLMGVSLDPYKDHPPILTKLLLSQRPELYNCKKIDSYDRKIAEYAKVNEIPITGLETVLMQLELINSLATTTINASPSSRQKTPVEALDEVSIIDFIDGLKKKRDSILPIVDAYRNQELAKLAALMTPRSEKEAKSYYELLDKRNLKWEPKIIELINAKPSFIAVGAAHLYGEKGIVNLLREAGYIVEPLILKQVESDQLKTDTASPAIGTRQIPITEKG